MTIRIEIQEQPERARFWAGVEVGGMVARRKEVMSPKADGLAGILRMVHEAAGVMDPRFTPPMVDAPNEDELRRFDAEADKAWPEMEALRAEARAAGVHVDGRWGTERLRQEIASVARQEIASAGQAEGAEDPRP